MDKGKLLKQIMAHTVMSVFMIFITFLQFIYTEDTSAEFKYDIGRNLINMFKDANYLRDIIIRIISGVIPTLIYLELFVNRAKNISELWKKYKTDLLSSSKDINKQGLNNALEEYCDEIINPKLAIKRYMKITNKKLKKATKRNNESLIKEYRNKLKLAKEYETSINTGIEFANEEFIKEVNSVKYTKVTETYLLSSEIEIIEEEDIINRKVFTERLVFIGGNLITSTITTILVSIVIIDFVMRFENVGKALIDIFILLFIIGRSILKVMYYAEKEVDGDIKVFEYKLKHQLNFKSYVGGNNGNTINN